LVLFRNQVCPATLRRSGRRLLLGEQFAQATLGADADFCVAARNEDQSFA
jgi:hypothetical protein